MPTCASLRAALLEETDLRVVECEDAEEAMAIMAREGEDVALVFADVRLPGLLDGVDLARRVKVLWPHVSMVVTSGIRRAAAGGTSRQRRLHAEAVARARRADAGRAGRGLDAAARSGA